MVKLDFKIAASVLLVAVIFMFLLYAGEGLGIDSEVMNDIIIVLPGLSVIVVGCLILGTVRTPSFLLPGLGAIGVGFAILLGEMNDAGMVVDTFVANGFPLIGLQGFSIVFCLIVGAMLTMRAGELS